MPLQESEMSSAPGKKLDALVSSCDNLGLELKYEKSDESVSVHPSVTHANDTLAKMLASVDEFVSKYTGEDHRNAVVNELKRRYNAKIKLFIFKEDKVPEQSKRQKHMMILTGKSSLEQMNWKTFMSPSLLSN